MATTGDFLLATTGDFFMAMDTFHAVLRHELFHFEVDCMIASWELATGVEVYWASRKYRNAAGYNELEEGLANAYMLRGFKYPSRLLGNAPGTPAVCRPQEVLRTAASQVQGRTALPEG